MLEPEWTYADLPAIMDVAEGSLKSCIVHLTRTCSDALEFLNNKHQNSLLTKLSDLVAKDFDRMTYTQAIEILKKSKKKFEHPVMWGKPLQSEHERYLSDEYCKKPVFVTHYPLSVKPFYMRESSEDHWQQGPDGQMQKTVACMDLLIPGVGELMGGSEREDNLDRLLSQMNRCGVKKSDYEWYLDLRRYGSVPHGGFGMGFERFLSLATGLHNVRDVTLVPRHQGTARI